MNEIEENKRCYNILEYRQSEIISEYHETIKFFTKYPLCNNQNIIQNSFQNHKALFLDIKILIFQKKMQLMNQTKDHLFQL